MIVIKDNNVIIIQPMGVKARELAKKMREKGVIGSEKIIFCG